HSRMEMHSGPEPETPRPADGGIRGRMHDARERAADFAERTRGGVEGTLHRASDAFERRDALINNLRQRPLTSVAVAFSVGFLAAAVQGRRKRNWLMDRVKRQ